MYTASAQADLEFYRLSKIGLSIHCSTFCLCVVGFWCRVYFVIVCYSSLFLLVRRLCFLMRPSKGFGRTREHVHLFSGNNGKYFKETREQNLFWGTKSFENLLDNEGALPIILQEQTSRHTTLKQRCFNVDSTSRRCFNVVCPLGREKGRTSLTVAFPEYIHLYFDVYRLFSLKLLYFNTLTSTYNK